jgi:chromosome partitioning protein
MSFTNQGLVCVIANQKGGVGKTTTAINLGACLGLLGRKTLLVDIDPQANTTSGLGFEKETDNSIYNVLVGDKEIKDVILKTEIDGLDLVPSSVSLTGAEIEMVDLPKREYRLKQKLDPILPNYEYVLIDPPPSLGLLTLNGFVAAKKVLIPIQCNYYALEGLKQLLSTISLVKSRLNSFLEVEGALLTMYDPRTNLSRQVVGEVRSFFGRKLFNTIIPQNVKLAETPSFGKPIVLYDITSKGAISYGLLAREVIGRFER